MVASSRPDWKVAGVVDQRVDAGELVERELAECQVGVLVADVQGQGPNVLEVTVRIEMITIVGAVMDLSKTQLR